jgi:hypothetical protein
MNYCWLMLLSVGQLVGAPVELVVGGMSSTIYETAKGFAQSDTDFSGVILADVELEALTGKPAVFRFTGGLLEYSDGETVYTPNQMPQVEELTFTSTGLAGPLVSLSTAPVVDPVTGLLTNADHVQNLTQGTLRTEYRVLVNGFWLTLFNDTRDFSINPESNPFSGATTIESELLEAGVLEDRYRIDLIHQSNETPQAVTDPDTGVSLTITSFGGFTASGEVTVPSAAYQAWLVAGGLPEAEDVEGRHPVTDLPLAVLYALGLDVDAGAIPLTVDGSTREAVITLPAGGSRAGVRLEYAAALEGWVVLGSDGAPGATVTLVGGATGELRIPLPVGGRGFLRLGV